MLVVRKDITLFPIKILELHNKFTNESSDGNVKKSSPIHVSNKGQKAV